MDILISKGTWFCCRNIVSSEAHLLEIFSHFLNTEDKVNCPALKENTTALQDYCFSYH